MWLQSLESLDRCIFSSYSLVGWHVFRFRVVRFQIEGDKMNTNRMLCDFGGGRVCRVLIMNALAVLVLMLFEWASPGGDGGSVRMHGGGWQKVMSVIKADVRLSVTDVAVFTRAHKSAPFI